MCSSAPGPGQSEASMAASGAAFTDLGAGHAGWGLRLAGCKGGMKGWDYSLPEVPRTEGRGSLQTGSLQTWTWVGLTGIPTNMGLECAYGLPGLRVGGGVSTRAHFWRLSQYLRTSRGGPRQACCPLLRCGGHRARAASLVEDHRDLPGPVAILPDQWAECPAGETSMWEG